MIRVCFYNTTTGKITSLVIIGGEEEIQHYVKEGESHIIVEEDGLIEGNTMMVVDGKITSRPPTTAHLDGTTVRGVPPGSKIYTPTQYIESEDGGDVPLTFTKPGLNSIYVESWPQVDAYLSYNNV